MGRILENDMTESALDKISLYPSAPIDRVAARVTGVSDRYIPDVNILTADQATPIRVRQLPWNFRPADDLTGTRRGRLTVIGLSADFNSRWVVRCDCGVYTLRTPKAVKNESNETDRCGECRHLSYLKRKDLWRQEQ